MLSIVRPGPDGGHNLYGHESRIRTHMPCQVSGACCRFRTKGAHGQGVMTFTDLASVPSDPPGPFTDRLRLAVAAYLARFKGTSREHTESDLRCYLSWCAEHGLDPLAAQRPHLELYIRWMQEIRRFKRSTVSRRFSVTRRVLPDLRPRPRPGALARRARAPSFGARRITDPGIHSPAVRGAAHRRPPVAEPV